MLRKDLQDLSLSKEMMIKSAWDKRWVEELGLCLFNKMISDLCRDAAVDARSVAEIELARNRVEMMQVSSNHSNTGEAKQIIIFPANHDDCAKLEHKN